jgi:hypothetical protein
MSLGVTCPKCGAPPGHGCWTATGLPTSTEHSERTGGTGRHLSRAQERMLLRLQVARLKRCLEREKERRRQAESDLKFAYRKLSEVTGG